MKISFVLNDEEMNIDVPANRRAVDLLREDLGFTGTKEGCGTGECGACSILVDGHPRLSCLIPASQLAGKRITTIEGIAPGPEKLHPVQQSFVECGAVQCGFCTPGMVITATDFLSRHPDSNRREMAEAISGNLCRCTGYNKILDAMEGVPQNSLLPDQSPSASTSSSLTLTSASLLDERPVFSPGSLTELWEIFVEQPKTGIFAGGTDLLVWIRNQRIDPPSLTSLEKIEILRGITETADEVRIGACTCHAELLDNPLIKGMFPVLTGSLKTLGSPHIRRMGTIGGNIVTASPAGDTLPPLQVLDAEVELLSATGFRRMQITDFILGPGKTTLSEGEILAAVYLPKPAGRKLQHFEKVGLRNAMACSVASLAAVIGFSKDGKIQSARLAWGSVGPTVVRIPTVEAALLGKTLSRDTLQTIIPLVAEAVSPLDDVRASADYRRLVAGNLLLRLLQIDGASCQSYRTLPAEKNL